MRITAGVLLMIFAFASIASGQEKPEAKKRERNGILFGDRRLEELVNIDGLHPPLRMILAKLEKATGTSMVLADNLGEHEPVLGSVQMRDVKAWIVMEMLEQRNLNDGRWVKQGDGYILTGVSTAPPKKTAKGSAIETPKNAQSNIEASQASASFGPFTLGAIFGGGVIGVAWYWKVRRDRRRVADVAQATT